MSNRMYTDKVRVVGGGRVCIMGSFAPNGASAIDNTQNRGRGWTVSRTGVGTYAVKLDDLYVQELSLVPGVMLATPADVKMQVTSYTPATGVVVLTALAVATAVEIAAAAGNRVQFEFWFASVGASK